MHQEDRSRVSRERGLFVRAENAEAALAAVLAEDPGATFGRRVLEDPVRDNGREIRTILSGTRFHRVLLLAGVIPPRTQRDHNFLARQTGVRGEEG